MIKYFWAFIFIFIHHQLISQSKGENKKLRSNERLFSYISKDLKDSTILKTDSFLFEYQANNYYDITPEIYTYDLHPTDFKYFYNNIPQNSYNTRKHFLIDSFNNVMLVDSLQRYYHPNSYEDYFALFNLITGDYHKSQNYFDIFSRRIELYDSIFFNGIYHFGKTVFTVDNNSNINLIEGYIYKVNAWQLIAIDSISYDVAGNIKFVYSQRDQGVGLNPWFKYDYEYNNLNQLVDKKSYQWGSPISPTFTLYYRDHYFYDSLNRVNLHCLYIDFSGSMLLLNYIDFFYTANLPFPDSTYLYYLTSPFGGTYINGEKEYYLYDGNNHIKNHSSFWYQAQNWRQVINTMYYYEQYIPNELNSQEEAQGNNNILFFPNPASTMLYFKCEMNEERKLYNASGKLLCTTKENEIDVSRYSKGVYYLKCGGAIEKLIIE